MDFNYIFEHADKINSEKMINEEKRYSLIKSEPTVCEFIVQNKLLLAGEKHLTKLINKALFITVNDKIDGDYTFQDNFKENGGEWYCYIWSNKEEEFVNIKLKVIIFCSTIYEKIIEKKFKVLTN